ncbi:hypothetical protein [Rufibacter roseolus]|uniref:hypothetical protein n=1 Tax=Rufibacter roseolus TaxID=2817375 RepID=UPI001B308B36|nr:hypothetical protein [Rufibacter roseolus]
MFLLQAIVGAIPYGCPLAFAPVLGQPQGIALTFLTCFSTASIAVQMRPSASERIPLLGGVGVGLCFKPLSLAIVGVITNNPNGACYSQRETTTPILSRFSENEGRNRESDKLDFILAR